jgi:hypothetical protein
MEKDDLVFKVVSLVRIRIELLNYPELKSEKPMVQKAIGLMIRYLPRVSDYLARQQALARPEKFRLILEGKSRYRPVTILRIFRYWVRKEKLKRILIMIPEALLLLFTPLLAMIPGPNVFFYIPFLFFIFHWRSLRGLARIRQQDLLIRWEDQEDEESG